MLFTASDDCPYAFSRPLRMDILRTGSFSESTSSLRSSHRYPRSVSL